MNDLDTFTLQQIAKKVYLYSLSSPKREKLSSSLLWLMLSADSFTADGSFMDADTDNGIVDIMLICRLDNDILTKFSDIKAHIGKQIEEAIFLLGAYKLNRKINEVICIGEMSIEHTYEGNKPFDAIKLSDYEPQIQIYYTVMDKKSYRVRHTILKTILSGLMKVYERKGKELSLEDMYLTNSYRKSINPTAIREAIEKLPETNLSIKSLIKANKPYMSENFMPYLKNYSLRDIITKIDEVFDNQRYCVICGKPFTARKENQIVCDNIRCQKRQSRIKRYVMENFKKNTPKKEIIKVLKERDEKTEKKHKGFDKIKDWDALIDKILKEW